MVYNVTYSLGSGGELQLDFSGAVTAPTPVNLVNHVYFNLAGHKAGADGRCHRGRTYVESDRMMSSAPMESADQTARAGARVSTTMDVLARPHAV